MIRVLHTADWHIGQFFHEYDRSYEHLQFLNWLLMVLAKEEIDVLLVSGDIFDSSNPSAASLKMFYWFLNQSVKQNPHLQVVVTAGNHDSASRLESPKPLLESSSIHIVGVVEKNGEGAIDYGKLCIPLKNKEGSTEVWCIAAPFLRMGDYPSVPDSNNPYAEGVNAFYGEAYRFASTLKGPGQAIIAMGHLHAQQAVVGDIDKAERLIMGGVECISAAAFNENIRYVALGHIHKAQHLGGKENVRYSGSPLPMSFSETNYTHRVVVFEIEDDKMEWLRTIEIPVAVPLLRIPAAPQPLSEVLAQLEQVEAFQGDPHSAPYLEVRVLLEGPEPGLRHQIETALAGKNFRLAKIDVNYKSGAEGMYKISSADLEQLNQLQPIEVLQKVYQIKYDSPVPEELKTLFRKIEQEVNEQDA